LRIIAIIQAAAVSHAAIAGHFSVSLPVVEKLRHRFRTTGKDRAKPPKAGSGVEAMPDIDASSALIFGLFIA